MPLAKGYGFSEHTEQKQNDFRAIINFHLNLCSVVRGKNPWIHPKYWYFDLNAGPGIFRNLDGREIVGSPLIFLDSIGGRNVPYHAVFIEQEAATFEALSANVPASLRYRTVTLEQGDHRAVFPNHFNFGQGKNLGVVYADPSGEGNAEPNFALLEAASKQKAFAMIDFLIYCPATTIKRSGKARLKDYLNSITKKCWLVREPVGQHQWTFLVGTNWRKFPDWEAAGLFHIYSNHGAEILDYLDTTAKEREARHGTQQPLPFLP